MAVNKNKPRNEATKLTQVSWALSLEETSARFPRIAWCCVSAALVAPPATPTNAFIVDVPHSMNVAWSRNWGRTNISIPMATSFNTSARTRHFLESMSSSVLIRKEFFFCWLSIFTWIRIRICLVWEMSLTLSTMQIEFSQNDPHRLSEPVSGIKNVSVDIWKLMNAECGYLFTHVTVADSGLAMSLPTPIPFKIACVVRVPV